MHQTIAIIANTIYCKSQVSAVISLFPLNTRGQVFNANNFTSPCVFFFHLPPSHIWPPSLFAQSRTPVASSLTRRRSARSKSTLASCRSFRASLSRLVSHSRTYRRCCGRRCVRVCWRQRAAVHCRHRCRCRRHPPLLSSLRPIRSLMRWPCSRQNSKTKRLLTQPRHRPRHRRPPRPIRIWTT